MTAERKSEMGGRNQVVTMERLAVLDTLEERDDYGILRPTEHAFSATWDLLAAVLCALPEPYPTAAVGSDAEGGIRVQWFGRTRQVRFVVGASATDLSYVYWQEGEAYGLESPVIPEILLPWLLWLTREGA